MSGKIQGAIYGRQLTAPQMLVALAMADHADHDGNNVRPAQATIAWKTGKSLRQVQRIQSELRDLGVLEITKNPGRGSPTEYRMVPEAVALRPRKVATPDTKGRHSEQKVATLRAKGRRPDVVQTVEEPSSLTVQGTVAKRDEHWDTLTDILGPPSNNKTSLQGKLVAQIKSQGHPPQEIRIRAERLVNQWGAKALTLPSLLEHWNRFGAPAGSLTKSDIEASERARFRQEVRARLEAEQ